MTVPDLLSFYRLAAAPVAAWLALGGHREAFFIVVIVSLFTDLVDGPIARWLGQDSSFGAKLDTVADACTLLVGIMGVWIFEAENIGSDVLWFYVFLASYVTATGTSLIKFGTLPAYHLYLSKAAAFASAIFFVWLFLSDYSRPFFLFVVGLGIAANLESLMLTSRLRKSRTDIKSILSIGARKGAGED